MSARSAEAGQRQAGSRRPAGFAAAGLSEGRRMQVLFARRLAICREIVYNENI